LKYFLNDFLIPQFSNLDLPSEESNVTIDFGYQDDPLKLELYNFFKSFNDKWVAGNSIGQNILMEEFLFLDKANRDIGDKVYLDMQKFIEIDGQDKSKANLMSIIQILIENSGFDIRPLPAYVNFYGTNINNRNKVTPSKKLGQNLFGTFLEVDYQDASPKIILQYMGAMSKYLDMKDVDNKLQLYKDDSFPIYDTNNNPIVVEPETFQYYDFLKSNKAVAFEVSFGDPSQSIFKGLDLDQTSIKNTSESYVVLERLGQQESGSSTAQIDIGLFNIYRQASYTCEVTAMGNAMIQPTMYFYLKNVPMFKGSYWIYEVYHDISKDGFQTRFRGTRIPLQALPDPEDSFMATYRTLFDNLLDTAVIKIKEQTDKEAKDGEKQTKTTNSEQTTSIDGYIPLAGEELIEGAGITNYRLPYNGYNNVNNIYHVRYNNQEWFRTKVVLMGHPTNYPISNDNVMSLLSRFEQGGVTTKILWSDINKNPDASEVYSSLFDIIDLLNTTTNEIISVYPYTEFLNPNNKTQIKIYSDFDFTNKKFKGPISIGPVGSIYGIALSNKLMLSLSITDGQDIYFRLSKE
jgi:hypothetical protein